VSSSGPVTSFRGSQGHPVKKGEYLEAGDRLETGPRAEAVLRLRNGGEVQVRPNSVLLFRNGESPDRLSLALEQGSLVGAGSKVQAAELLISVGEKRVRLTGEARATVAVPDKEGTARVEVMLGQATIEGETGTQTVVAGQELVVETHEPRVKPDARVSHPDASIEKPTTRTFFLQRTGRGGVLVKSPGSKRFARIPRAQWVEVAPGTVIKLLRGAQARFGSEKGKGGTLLTGPGIVVVKETGADSPGSPLEHVQGDIVLSQRGPPGTRGSSFTIDGVSITPVVRYRQADIRIRRKGNRNIVIVNSGQADLKAKVGSVSMEAGQEATITNSSVSSPRMPAQAPFQIRHMGAVRVFTNDVQLPVTFRWKDSGGKGTLVQVSRSPGMARPLFSDIVTRQVLTIPDARRGTLYWSVAPVDEGGTIGKAEQGRLTLVKDTSYRELTGYKPPSNTIHESYNNTTVFYQNRLPRFAFRWNAIEGATRYTLKIFREQNLQAPVVNETTRKLGQSLKPGTIGEGNYLWYVVGRSDSDELVKALKGRRLSVRYDNATPDLQIVAPRHGLVAGSATIEARGVTIPGSKVFVNGAAADLDQAFRFTHVVKLNAGVNLINFRVISRKGVSSIYLRRVVRK